MLKKSKDTSVEWKTCEQALAAFEERTGLDQGAARGWRSGGGVGRCGDAPGARESLRNLGEQGPSVNLKESKVG
jgi:hypothetical protein